MSREANQYIRVFSGRKFWPLDPRPDEIDIVDIAHSLSNNCRWGGHSRWFYSIAQHCCMVHDLLPVRSQRAGLLHDASEAYILDMPRPIKYQMPEYQEIERHLMYAIRAKFGFNITEDVKGADDLALYVEKQSLFSSPAREVLTDRAVDFYFHRRIDADQWYRHPVEAWSPATARYEFLERFHNLPQ